MNNILLTSEAYVKTITQIDDNLAGKYLLPTLRIVQDIRLKEIIGDCLLKFLQQLIAENHISEEAYVWYKDLLDNYIQPYLAHQALVEMVDVIANKITNAGLVTVTDEHIQQTYATDRNSLKEHYQRIADSYKLQMAKFLVKNRTQFPELDNCSCESLNGLTGNAYTGGLFLDGVRGKMYPRNIRNEKL